MTAIDKSPSNPNFLSRGGFKLVLKRAPYLNFYVQKVNIPSISIDPTQHPNPFVKIPYSGDHIEFEPLSVTFKVDEDLKNWLEIYNWMIGLGFPENQKQYQDLAIKDRILQEGIKSEIVLFLLSSHRNPIYEVVFHDCFPINLSGLEFDSTLNEVDYIESTVSFTYTRYEVKISE